MESLQSIYDHLTYTIGSIYPDLKLPIKNELRGKMDNQPDKPIRHMIMDYFRANPNREVTLTELIHATGLLTVQVQGNISNIMANNRNGNLDFTIERIKAGQIWIYRPDVHTKPVNKVERIRKKEPEEEVKNTLERIKSSWDRDNVSSFQKVGVTKKGTVIIQDSDGNLYRAEELDI